MLHCLGGSYLQEHLHGYGSGSGRLWRGGVRQLDYEDAFDVYRSIDLRLEHCLIPGPNYTPSSSAGKEIPKEVVSRAITALDELRRHLPEDHVLPMLPISLDDLRKMAEKER